MHIESVRPKKIVVEKEALPGTGKFVYGATDRFGGEITFISEYNRGLGEAIIVPKKPKGEMTVEAFWKKSGQSIRIIAGSAALASSPSIAQTLGAAETVKILAKQAGLPESVGTLKPIDDVVTRTIELSKKPMFNFVAIASATFVLVLGLQRVWSPDRSRDAALITAGLVAAAVTGAYAIFA